MTEKARIAKDARRLHHAATLGLMLLLVTIMTGCGGESVSQSAIGSEAAHEVPAAIDTSDATSVVSDPAIAMDLDGDMSKDAEVAMDSVDSMETEIVESDLPRSSDVDITANDIRAGRDAFIVRPIDRAATGFKLLDQDGNETSLSDFRGKWVVMDWIYTNCMTVCPALTGEMLKVKEALGDRLGDEVELVTFSFDFERDDVSAMKTYADKVGGNVPGWSWLTGEKFRTDAIAQAYGVSYTPAPAMMGVAMFDHTALTVIVDPGGRERHHYYGVGWGEDMIERLNELVPVVESAPDSSGSEAVDLPLVGLSENAAAKLEDATSYYWEEWELDPGITGQSVHNFAGTIPTKRYFVARMSGLEEAGWINLGKEDEDGEAFGIYFMFQGPDSSYIGVGTNENVMVEIRGESFTETLDALFWLGGALCCPA